MDDKLINLIFGSLLHDIGKVVYRGSSERATHSLLGAKFIKEMRANADSPELEEAYNDAIVEQISHHHARALASSSIADDSLAWITYFADNISAGMDRREHDEEEGDDEGEGEGNGDGDSNGEGVGVGEGSSDSGEGAGEGVGDGAGKGSDGDGDDDSNGEGDDKGAKWNRAANLQRIFNILNGHNDNSTIAHEDYNALRERIRTGLRSIAVSQNGIGSLLNLLEATCDKVPSSTNVEQLIDVSLFDHSKTTAGIAACLYLWLQENEIANYKMALFSKEESPKYYNREVFLLWSCDISGIQSFIYNISGEGALKQLRARSFYLEMMLEHIADELLCRLGLSRCNLLYTGGGHAYMLLPNTSDAKEALEQFEQELKTWMLERFRTDLYVACAWVPCSAEDLANDNLCNNGADRQRHRRIFRQLGERLSAKKSNRYTADDLRLLNFPDASAEAVTGASEQAPAQAVGDHSRECRECHKSDASINGNGVCPQCEALAKVSAALVRDDVFVVGNKGLLELPFDKRLSTYSAAEYLKEFGAGNANAQNHRVYTKNRWDTGINLATHLWMGDYTANTWDTAAKEYAGISAYAQSGATLPKAADGEPPLGIKRLAVLRADVDNLGAIFTSGLPDSKISISRTATLSRQLSLFFKYELNNILAKKPLGFVPAEGLERGEHYQAQIIYSGGDDLFIIGNWSDMLYAAMAIRKALDDFTGNGVLTISAGIGMYDAHYPIARMAEEVGRLEDAAKNYRKPSAAGAVGTAGAAGAAGAAGELLELSKLPTKNAIALWSSDAVFGWDEFIKSVYNKLGDIQEVFDNNEKGKAFIYKLLILLRSAREDAISIPRLAYLLARSFEDVPDCRRISEKFYSWATDEQESKYLIAALEWYIYSVRERG